MSNRLNKEQSPYLLQHAHNPVHWFPWCDEAFDLARQAGKPVLVSIGYAACHWCHVMEKESFENESTAAYMNEHFVCIKVDREEHPDVDHMYMDAVQALTGSGGWPLNVFATPDRVPFYGGTYYPPRPAFNKPSWLQLLQRMNDIWTNQNDEAVNQADQMIKYLRQASMPAGSGTAQWGMKECREIAETLLKQADTMHGGFGNAPKFPAAMAISFLLEHYHYTGHIPALNHALLSLDRMIDGGIYDQLGGGFARYSTDSRWLAPHFEKMLYDNALLVSSLCDAFTLTNNEKYKKVIDQVVSFAERELKDSSGGWYSSLDADSEGVEGKFYTWTWDEWLKAAEGGNEAVRQYFGITEEGNWEHTNILHVFADINEVAAKNKLEVEALRRQIDKVSQKLWICRQKRVRPITDDKSLLSWNAMMNISVTKAGVALQNSAYVQRASAHMEWMLEQFENNGVLKHTWKQGVAKIEAKLDDHAFLIQALLQLGSAQGNINWILKAGDLNEYVISHFSHEDGFYFYFTSDMQQDIPVRKIDTHDGAVPSANSIMAHNLLLLGLAMERTDWLQRAAGLLNSVFLNAARYPYSFGYWNLLLQRKAAGFKVVTGAGAKTVDSLQLLKRYLLPHCYIVATEKEISELPVLRNKYFLDKVLIFVCTEEACMSPLSNTGEVLQIINTKQYLP